MNKTIIRLKNFSKRHKRNIFTVILSALVIASGFASGLPVQDIKFEKEEIYTAQTMAPSPKMMTEELSVFSNITEGTALYIDGNYIGAVKESADIELVLEKYRKEYENKTDGKDKKSEFIQEISLQKGLFDEKELLTQEDLLELLHTAKTSEIDYTVQEGDTISKICDSYNMTQEAFEKLNGKDVSLKVGENVHVLKSTQLLSVKVTLKKQYSKTTPYDTVIIYDDNEYADVSYVSKNGQNGVTAYTDEIVYIDGEEISRTNIEEKIVSSVINEEITEGTIEQHYGMASGTFLWPVPSTTMVTSEFGYRWGTNHNGMDISGSNVYGADIVASDGGTVTFASEDNSGYGKHIIIDHGNGFETHYAHCSALYVSEGEQVYAGQVIAAVGSTGYSTGPHLHFEVILNGTKVDPRNYL